LTGLLWNARMLESLVFNIKLYKNKANTLEQCLDQNFHIPQTLWKFYNLQLSYSIIGTKVGSNQCLVIFDF
jgi:hypothetical protein